MSDLVWDADLYRTGMYSRNGKEGDFYNLMRGADALGGTGDLRWKADVYDFENMKFNPTNTKTGFNLDGFLGSINTGVDIASGLAGIYGMQEGLKQSKKEFNFNKNLANTNLYNQAQLTREGLAGKAASRWGGSTALRDQYGGDKDKYMSEYTGKYAIRDKV
jgi:hypothetical protein